MRPLPNIAYWIVHREARHSPKIRQYFKPRSTSDRHGHVVAVQSSKKGSISQAAGSDFTPVLANLPCLGGSCPIRLSGRLSGCWFHPNALFNNWDLLRNRDMQKTRSSTFEYVEPIGARVLVRKDDPKRETKGGIALPDQAEIPTITGRIVSISSQIENSLV